MRGRRGDATRGLGTHPAVGFVRPASSVSRQRLPTSFVAVRTARVGRMRRPREADLKRNIPCAGSMIVASRPPGGGAPDTVESNGCPATAFRQGTRPIRARGN